MGWYIDYSHSISMHHQYKLHGMNIVQFLTLALSNFFASATFLSSGCYHISDLASSTFGNSRGLSKVPWLLSYSSEMSRPRNRETKHMSHWITQFPPEKEEEKEVVLRHSGLDTRQATQTLIPFFTFFPPTSCKNNFYCSIESGSKN